MATSAGLLPLSSLPKPLTLPYPSQRGLAGRPQISHGPQGLLKQMVGPWLKGHRRPHPCNCTTSLQLGRTLKMTCSLHFDSCVMWSLYASPPCHRWGALEQITCQTDVRTTGLVRVHMPFNYRLFKNKSEEATWGVCLKALTLDH